MKNIFTSTMRALTLVALLATLWPAALHAQSADDYFTVVLFGDPEVNLTNRDGNNATQANLTRWAEGIVNMHQNADGYFNFQRQPAGFTPRADLVICMGDMDGDSETSGTAIKAVFKKFTDAGIPFITMIGNHDVVPDYYNGGDVGPTTYGGHKANTFAYNLVTSYLTTAQKNGIENLKRFESDYGVNQAKPFTFTFRGVRFYIGQTYWFQKTYDNNTPLFGSGTPPTTYIPYDVVNSLDAFVQANASTPSVWVQHYPIDAADRWWNDCNENGRCITPANEDANMKTAEQKRNRYKEIIAKSANPWHFSGHQHSAYKHNYTTNGTSFTDHVAPYFATNGSAYIALCQRGVGVVEVRQVCFDPSYQTPTVQDLGQLSNDKAYTITCGNGFLYYNPSVANAASGVATGLDSNNPNHQWAVVTQNGLNYLYSVGARKFARKPANSTNSTGTVLELVDTPDANSIVTLEFNNSDTDHPWLIKFGGVTFNVSPGETGTHGVLMGGWTTLDGGNRFAISEVGDFEGIQDVKDELADAGLDNLVTAGNLTTGWYQLWSDVTTLMQKPKLITKVSQMSSPKTQPGEGSLAALIDGDASTYWHSNWAEGAQTMGSATQLLHYVQFDLGGTYQDLTFTYHCRNSGSDKPTAFAVTASNDANGTFTEVATITSVGTDASVPQSFRINLGAQYRYIRLRASATGGQGSNRGYWHAAEMQFYPGEVKPKLITAASQLSSPKTQSGEGSLASLIDDNPSTYWHSNWTEGTQAFGSATQLLHYVQFDLGSAHQDLTLVYRCRNTASNKPTSFAVTACNTADGTYTDVATITGVGTNPNDLQSFHLNLGAQYRYVRLRATATAGDEHSRGFWHAAEMQFYPGEVNVERVQAYYKTLNISDAPASGGNLYDMVSASNGSDINTLFYLERVGNGQFKLHLPTGHSVGTNCSRTNEATSNVITATAPDDDPSLLQLKNDANHGNGYWNPISSADYAGGLIIGAGTGFVTQRWKFLNVSDKMIDYDVWTIVPKVNGNTVPLVHYNAEGYTGVSEFTTGGMLILPKGTTLSPDDFTVDEEGSTVRIDAASKQIVVTSKVYRLGKRITSLSQIKDGGKYMMMNALGKSQHATFCRWAKHDASGDLALEQCGLPAALRQAPLDANVFADKMWTFTASGNGYRITSGTNSRTVTITDYANGGNLRGGNNNDYPDPRFYFEDMDEGTRNYSTCKAGDGFWLIDTGGTGTGKYWNGASGGVFSTWSNGHPYVIYQVEEVTTFDTDYSVSANAQGFVNRSNQRRTEWVSLKVDDGEPVKVENLQSYPHASLEYRPVYWDKTGTHFVCPAGATLTPAVGVQTMNSMQASFFIDEDGDGFENGINAVDNSQHKVLPGHDLKTLSGYLYGGSAWFNSKGESSNTNNLDMPSFTAPTKPGIYRVRYLVGWNTVDPAGYANIASDGGIIVDVTLEVQPADVLNKTLDDAASIRADILNQRGLGYPRTESEAYRDLDAALSAANHEVNPEIGSGHLVHVDNADKLNALGNGSLIALQCRDTNGGSGYYFNGPTTKSATFGYDNNLYVMEQSANGYKLRRHSDNQYVGHGNGFSGTVTHTDNVNDATEFTFAFAAENGSGSMMTGTVNSMTIRLTAYNQSTFLNAQASGNTPKYANGEGGYSVWYVYEYVLPSDTRLIDLKTALLNYYTCTDVELPEDGNNYTVTPDGGTANDFLLVANDDEEGTVRLVGNNVRYYDGTDFSDGYSTLDNNLKITKYGSTRDHLGALKIGEADVATRWTLKESPAAVEPTYQSNSNGTTLMTLPGVNTSAVAVYANDEEVTADATITAGDNTTVLLPAKPNRTWFTVYAADASGIRRFQYQLLSFQTVTLTLTNDATGITETIQKKASIGSTMADVLAELHPKCVVTQSSHEEIEDGVLTGYAIHYTPKYEVEGHGNNSHASRYTDNVSLKVGNAPALTVATGQTTTGPVYVDKRSETFVCGAGQPLQPTVNFHGHAMHAFVYVDANHDGFLASAADIENNVLKTAGNIDLRTFSYFNGHNSAGDAKSSDEGETNCVAMPAFNAPATPGTYVMRYKVDWDSLDPDGTENIAAYGGIIVDVTLEVRDYNMTVKHQYDGEVQQTVYEYINAADATGWSPTRIVVPAGYAPDGGWPSFDIDDDYNGNSINIFYTYDESSLPIAFTATDADGTPTTARYFTMTVHGKNAFFQHNNNGGGGATNQIKLTADNRTRDVNDYFYFVGDNHEGFTLHSTAVSPVLSFDISSRKFTLTANKYRLVDTFDGTTHKYAVRVATSNALMNEDYGTTGNLGIWSGSPDPTDPNALFTFTAADNATVEAAIAAVPWPETGKHYYVKSGFVSFPVTKAVTVGDNNAPRWDTADEFDPHFVWQVTTTGGGKYAFLNMHNNRYLKKVGETSEESANAYLIYIGDNRFEILTSEEHAMHAGGHSGGAGTSGSIISYYGGGNDPSSWILEEVDYAAMLECIEPHNTLVSLLTSAVNALGTSAYTGTDNLITAATQLATNAGHNELGAGTDGDGIPALVDGYTSSYFHSSYSDDNSKNTANAKHLLQIDFIEPRECVQLKWWKRNDNNRPATIEVWGTNDASLATLATGKNYTTTDYNQAEWTPGWTKLQTLTIDNTGNPVTINAVRLHGNRYVRLNVMSTNTSTRFFTMAEIQAYEHDPELSHAVNEAYTLIDNNSKVRTDYEREIANLKTIIGRPLRISLGALIADKELWHGKVGEGLGKYSMSVAENVYTAQMATAKTLAANETADVDDLQTAIETLTAWTFAINTPQPGQFIRIRNAATPDDPANRYATNDVNCVSTTGANTIFYCTVDASSRNVLVGYGNGECPELVGNSSTTNATHLLSANTMEYTFTEALNNVGAGEYYVQWGNRYIYGLNLGGLDGGTGANSTSGKGYNWTLEEVTSLPVTISGAGWATFYSPKAVAVPDGVTAYVAVKDGAVLHLNEVDAIAAEQGVILKGNAGTYYFDFADEGNDETCALSGKVASATSSTGDYVLSIGTINGKANQVGFFPVNSGEVLKGFKAYLNNPTARVAAFRFSFNELATAIDAANDTTLDEGTVYNIAGQRVQKANGIVIVNGKKVMVNNK